MSSSPSRHVVRLAVPPSPTELRSRPHSATDIRFVNLIRGRIRLDWDSEVTGLADYEVQQKINGTWEPLTSATLEHVSGETHAIVGDLEFRMPHESSKIYEHRVRTKATNGQVSAWTTLSTAMTLPYIGRQQDHTVQYSLGAEGPASIGAAFPDPRAVSDSALATAVAGWNSSPVATGPPRVLICKAGECGGRANDNWTVLINVAAGGCGSAPACVRLTPSLDGYMKAMTMVMEQPGTSGSLVWIWTNDASRHGDPVPRGMEATGHSDRTHRYFYMPEVYMHELGHALGLYDLYLLRKYPDVAAHLDIVRTMMDYPVLGFPCTDVNSFDADYVRKVYEGHPTPEHRLEQPGGASS